MTPASRKSGDESASSPQPDPAAPSGGGSTGPAEGAGDLQKAFDEAAEKGYFGEQPEGEPDHTVEGSVKAQKESEGK